MYIFISIWFSLNIMFTLRLIFFNKDYIFYKLIYIKYLINYVKYIMKPHHCVILFIWFTIIKLYYNFLLVEWFIHYIFYIKNYSKIKIRTLESHFLISILSHKCDNIFLSSFDS